MNATTTTKKYTTFSMVFLRSDDDATVGFAVGFTGGGEAVGNSVGL
jgi:hypothetical protein